MALTPNALAVILQDRKLTADLADAFKYSTDALRARLEAKQKT
jgi:hypothetical protein